MIKLNNNFRFVFVIVILITIILSIAWHNHKYHEHLKKYKKSIIIPENKSTLKFTVKPRITKNGVIPFKEMDMMFEEADIEYYNQPEILKALRPEETFIFHQTRPEVEDPIAIFDIHTTDIGGSAGIDNTDFMDMDNRMFDAILENDIHENTVMNTEIALYDPDSQNVHDTEVSKAVRKIYSNIDIAKHNKSDSNVLFSEIMEYADMRRKSQGEKNKIEIVLDKVYGRNGKISNVNDSTELDLLSSIWKESNQRSTESGKNIKDMLLLQIADTYDNDTNSVSCPSGFVNKIATALIVEHPEEFPKTKAMMNEEMLQSASFVQEQLRKDKHYNELSETMQVAEFKNKLNEKLENDYFGILTKDEIQKSIEPWIDHI